MTSKGRLLGSFVAGRYTPVAMIVASLVLMVVAYWFPSVDAQMPAPAFIPLSAAWGRGVSVLLYIVTAALFSRQTFFERRIHWKGALYLWLVAVMTSSGCNPGVALLSLLFFLSLLSLLYCQYGVEVLGLQYTSFAFLGIASLLTPGCLWLVPLFLSFGFFANTFSFRGVMASILGFATPLWLLFGAIYLFPQLEYLAHPFFNGIKSVFAFGVAEFSVLEGLRLALALLVMVPAVSVFAGSASPAKPLLRRRLLFLFVQSVYTLLVSFLVVGCEWAYDAWLLPGLAVMLSLVLSNKPTKLLNAYFIVIIVLLFIIYSYPLWLMLL